MLPPSLYVPRKGSPHGRKYTLMGVYTKKSDAEGVVKRERQMLAIRGKKVYARIIHYESQRLYAIYWYWPDKKRGRR